MNLNKKTLYNARKVQLLFKNFLVDFKLYLKHSIYIKKDSDPKFDGILIRDYHSIEKGFLHENFKHKFGKEKVKNLIQNLEKPYFKNRRGSSQVQSSYLALITYYERHLKDGVDISDFFDKESYNFYKKSLLTENFENKNLIEFTEEEYFSKVHSDFKEFSKSRKSVREFSGEVIPLNDIKEAIDIARFAPSVCNRQGWKIYYTDNKKKIDELLSIQGGVRGFSQNINQLLFLTMDRNYFHSIGERYQFYIDGGIMLMNLLYSLHYKKIAACPANWSKRVDQDVLANSIFDIPENEKIICTIPIGKIDGKMKSTLSWRKDVDEILIIKN